MNYFRAINNKTGELRELWSEDQFKEFQKNHTVEEFLEYLNNRELYIIDEATYTSEVQERAMND